MKRENLLCISFNRHNAAAYGSFPIVVFHCSVLRWQACYSLSSLTWCCLSQANFVLLIANYLSVEIQKLEMVTLRSFYTHNQKKSHSLRYDFTTARVMLVYVATI